MLCNRGCGMWDRSSAEEPIGTEVLNEQAALGTPAFKALRNGLSRESETT